MNDQRMLAALLTVAQAVVYHKDSARIPTQPSREIVSFWYGEWIKRLESQPTNEV